MQEEPMKTIEEYRTTGKELYDALRLSTFPVAVKYFRDPSDIPAGFIRPTQFRQKWSLCQAITYARRGGARVAMTADDNFCVPASYGQGWLPGLTFDDLIESQRLNKWRGSLEAEKKVQAAFAAEVVKSEGYAKIAGTIGFLLCPLADTPYVPDSILLYGSPGQLTHIIQALSYEGKHIVQSTFIGFAESCMKGILFPHVTGKPQYVAPGMGDQTLSGTNENEVAIGIPGDLLFYIKEQLFRTGGGTNKGLAIPTLLARQLREKKTPGWVYLKKKIDEMNEGMQ
jgi:uncharacterized protein (DUF169 family)